jgi:predicted  nucleic acid-binding Zn-ribbon protein
LLQPIHAAVDTVVDFVDQFVRLEVENAQLREAVKSSSDQLQQAKSLATDAQNENKGLKEELKTLKKKLKEEQELKLKAYAEADKKEGALRKSIECLLSKISSLCFSSFFCILLL